MSNDVNAAVHSSSWGPYPAVLVHGGTPGGGSDAFAAQRPLAAKRQLLLPDRPGHGQTPGRGREDFERDADLLASLLGTGGAHLVGHSYGGVVAIYMAARRPELIRSLTLIEPPAYWLAADDPVVAAMSAENRELTEHTPTDPRETIDRFFALVGIPALPAALDRSRPLPPPLAAAARVVVGLRGPWEGSVPMAALVAGGYPIQLLTSGCTAGFEGIAEAFVTGAGATHVVVPGTHHAVQEAGEQVNVMLEAFWSAAEDV